MSDIPLSLYIHFPWCVRKCPYCDFNSHVTSEMPEAQYLACLVADLKAESAGETRDSLHSIFIGGGTPSLITPQTIGSLLDGISRHFNTEGIEITIEANPGTYDQSHFDGYAAAGVNRISIGAQSFAANSLEALGRVHNPDDVFRSFDGARRAGFTRINLDLMHGLPGQTREMAERDLLTAISLGPEHISWYQLTIEPNTVFYRYPPVLPPDETLESVFDMGLQRLADAGFEQYEVSAFARQNQQSRHNLNYWQFGDYMGIGAGAHGKLTRGGSIHRTIHRTTRTRVPADYMSDPSARCQAVKPDDVLLEFLLNAMRLTDGFDIRLFEQRTGLPADALKPFINRGLEAGFLEPDAGQGRVVPTPRGRWYLNDLLLLV